MSEGGGGHESFLWENQPWELSDNSGSGGGGGGGVNEEKTGKKMLDSSTSNDLQTQIGGEAEVALAVPGKKRSGVSKKEKGSSSSDQVNEGKGGESDHEIHIWTERERRKKMRNMFSNLHALLPQLPPKADKSTIVDEAVSYIKTLQQTLQKLQKQKLERLHGITTINYNPPIIPTQKLAPDTREAFLADQGSSSNLAIPVTNSSNSFSLPQFPTIFQTWTSPNVTLNVCGEDAQISVCSSKKHGLFTAICYVLEKHKLEVVSAHVSSDHCRSMYMIQAHANAVQFPEAAFPIEEIYKQAVAEIMLWVSS